MEKAMPVRRILTLDGGGIRGLVSAIWLEALQARLHAAGKGDVRSRFDLIAGSSTGALIAAGLAWGLPPGQLTALYEHFGDEVFPGAAERLWSRLTRAFSEGLSAPRYSPRGLETVLQRVFGEGTLGQASPRLMAIAYDTLARSPVFFKSFKPEHASIPLWEVCRAATAAPAYFPAHLTTIGGQYDLSVGKLVSYPIPFSGDGPDLFLSVFGMVTHVNSDDKFFDPNVRFYNGVTKWKLGGEMTYSVLPLWK